MVFIKSITDDQKIHETIIKPFYEMGTKDGFEGYLESLPNYSSFQDKEQLLQQILMGSLAIFWGNNIYIFDVKKIVDTGSPKLNKYSKWMMPAVFATIALYLCTKLDETLIFKIGEIWVNLRFGLEIVLVGLLFYAARRKKA